MVMRCEGGTGCSRASTGRLCFYARWARTDSSLAILSVSRKRNLVVSGKEEVVNRRDTALPALLSHRGWFEPSPPGRRPREFLPILEENPKLRPVSRKRKRPQVMVAAQSLLAGYNASLRRSTSGWGSRKTLRNLW